MKKKRNSISSFFNLTLALALIGSPLGGAPACAEDNAADEVLASTAAPRAAAQPEETPRAEKAAGNEQLLGAIADLNYKIEYLQAGNNKLNAEIEELRLADRDQRNMLNDRISAIPAPDTARLESLESDSAQMKSDISRMKADIAGIQEKLSASAQTRAGGSGKGKLSNSEWLAVGALGLSVIAIITR